MDEIRIPHPSSEASALLGIQNRGLLDALQWRTGFWTISDEAPAPKAIALLGERRSDGSWEVVSAATRLSKRSSSRKAEDCESMARAGSWIYVFGSQFGSKEGPLEPRRHFVMRFNEALVDRRKTPPRVEVDVVRAPFLLHRILNDALLQEEIEILPPGDHLHHDLVDTALDRGEKKKKRWRKLVHRGDSPINVEGATFLHGGHLLLGLRHPVTKEGHPILVEIEGIDRLFEDDPDSLPEVIGFRVITNIGSPDRPAGVRELDSVRDVVHVLTGNLDSDASHSAVIDDHPEGAKAPCEHWVVPLQPLVRGVVEIEGRREREFEEERIEGIALAGDECWYVRDDEEIVLLRTKGDEGSDPV